MDEIEIIDTGLDCTYPLSLIEKISNSSHPFVAVSNRPHLGSYIPFEKDPEDSEHVKALKKWIDLNMVPHIDAYKSKHRLESLKTRPNLIVSKLEAGRWMDAHVDCAIDSRAFITQLYLNNDYTGGDLYFRDLDLSIPTKAGRLIIAPGKHYHGVSPVTSGSRISMGMGYYE